MQPDDFGQRNLKCCMCDGMTSRLVGDQAVCDRHFFEGWGRLPNMPLPQPKELGAEIHTPPAQTITLSTYPCSKCESNHTFTSRIGKNHQKHRRE